MRIAELAPRRIERLAEKKLGAGLVATLVQQPAEVADGGQRVRMRVAERAPQRIERLLRVLRARRARRPQFQQQQEVRAQRNF